MENNTDLLKYEILATLKASVKELETEYFKGSMVDLGVVADHIMEAVLNRATINE